jgi:hypothetical protein
MLLYHVDGYRPVSPWEVMFALKGHLGIVKLTKVFAQKDAK